MAGESDAAIHEEDAFALEKAALKPGERLAHGDAAAGRNDAMPGDGLAARASGHGAARGACSSQEPGGASHLAVSDHASLGDALDEFIHSAPTAGHAEKDNRYGNNFPVLPLYETEEAE